MHERKVSIIVFYDTQKRILLQKRSPHAKAEWAFFGGGIEPGETPEQALIRETKEELGHDLTEYTRIGTFRNPQTPELLIELHAFISPLRDHFASFVLGEGDGMRLFSFEEAQKLKMYPGDDIILKELQKRI